MKYYSKQENTLQTVLLMYQELQMVNQQSNHETIMRKVKFKRFIKAEYQTLEGRPGKYLIPGTGQEQPDFFNVGVFHQWANQFEDSGEGFGNYTVALVELPDGTMEEVLPSRIKFIS